MFFLEEFEELSSIINPGEPRTTSGGWHSFKVTRSAAARNVAGSPPPTTGKKVTDSGKKPESFDDEDIEDVVGEFRKKGFGELDPTDPETTKVLRVALKKGLIRAADMEAWNKEVKEHGKGSAASAGKVGTGSGTAGTSTGIKEQKRALPKADDDEDENTYN